MANSRRWVVNASPLIVLGKIGQLELLGSLAESIVVPRSVTGEVAAGSSDDPSKHWRDAGVGKSPDGG